MAVVNAAELALPKKQAEFANEVKNRDFSLRMKAAESETSTHAQKLDFERQQRQFEFQQMLKKVKIDQATAVQIKHTETTRPAMVPVTKEKMNISKHLNTHPDECFHTFLARFSDVMEIAQIIDIQWVVRLLDILTNNAFKTFQDLSYDDWASFATVRDKILTY